MDEIQRPAADWDLWQHMPKATVREAVFLSLDIEPRLPGSEVYVHYAQPGKDFDRRLTLACAYVAHDGPLHPLGYGALWGGPEQATVNLGQFAAWAKGMGWSLPERFPVATVAAPVQPPPSAPATEAAPEAPASEAPAPNPAAWTVDKPKRFSAYAAPLYRLLTDAQRQGKPRPTARDVVEAWQHSPPAEIAKMLPEGFDYYDVNGNTKAANLDAIRQAINRMTSGR